MTRIVLPYPPSVNHYWRHVGPKVLISAEGRMYRERVAFMARQIGCQSIVGRLSVEIQVHPPDRRVRDLDNLPKAILDAATHAGLWADDSLIDDLRIWRAEVTHGGMVVMYVESLEKKRKAAT